VCLDIGASTGGFTDCLLQSGALHVFAVDVGFGLLDSKIRMDPRVSCVDRKNARYLELRELETKDGTRVPDLAVVDVSFISLEKILIPMRKEASAIRDWVCLFKPQFEVARRFVERGGRVKNTEAVRQALDRLNEVVCSHGFRLVHGPIESPIVGKKGGNVEYLLHYETKLDY
jgi:23S rRNA (cytidine1920-2'-O)/16S rRNA (cytidine1409-2'-O)-methyltransferase